MTPVEILTIISTSVALLITLYKYVLRPLTRWVRKLIRAIDELLPNGGSSVKDSISRIDRMMQLSESRVKTIMDRDIVAIYECDVNGACTYANNKLCSLFGLGKEQMLGNGWLEGVEPIDRERTYDTWRSAVAKSLPFECDYTVRSVATGVKVRARTVAHPMYDTRHNVIGYHGVLWKIDDNLLTVTPDGLVTNHN